MRNGLAQQDVQESHRLLTRFCIKKNSQSQIILKGSIVLFLSTKFCSVRNELSLRIFFDVTFFDAESDGECVGSCQHWWNFCCSIVWSGFCCYGKKFIFSMIALRNSKTVFICTHPPISLSIHLYLLALCLYPECMFTEYMFPECI